MGVGSAVQADDGEVDAVVGTGNLSVAFGGRADSEARCADSQLAVEFPSRDHIFSLIEPLMMVLPMQQMLPV